MPSPHIATLFEKYLEDAEHRQIADLKSLRSHAKRPLQHWGALTFDQFCAGRNDRVRAYTKARRADGVCDSTINRELRLARTVFNFAEGEDLIAHSVKIKAPAPRPPRKRVLAPGAGGELDRLMRALRDRATPAHTGLAVHLALLTGQRTGAIHALRWGRDIDFDAGMIFFSRTTAKVTKKARVDKAMTPELAALLQAARVRATCEGVIEWRGKPVRSSRGSYKALLARARISEATFHDLRRTSATLVRHLLSLEDAANHIGDTQATTARVYAQEDPRKSLKAQSAVARELGL